MGIRDLYANASFNIILKLNVYRIFRDLSHVNVKLQRSNIKLLKIYLKKILNSKLAHESNIKQAGINWQVLAESPCLPVYSKQYLYKSSPFCSILGQDIQHNMTKFGVCHSFFV